MTAFQAGWNVAQTQGALDSTMFQLRALQPQVEALRSRLEEQRRLDQMKLDLLNRSYAQALDMASTVGQKFNDLKNDIIRDIS